MRTSETTVLHDGTGQVLNAVGNHAPHGEVVLCVPLEDVAFKGTAFFAFARLPDSSGGLYNSSKSHFADYRIEM